MGERAETTAFFFGSTVEVSTALEKRAPRLPEAFGRYRVESLLGEGAFGLVYRGFDPELRRPVAIKVPKRARIASESDVEAYMEEARILAGLDHPGIVAVHDLGRTEDRSCYVVSKFIQGNDLQHRIGAAPPSLAEAVSIVAQAAEALDYAHERGLVHRDIKPANLLIDRQGQVFVADFGLAITPEDLGLAFQVAGTPAYMSPEQIGGDVLRLDGRSDLFSLGVVLYQLLTGRMPFEAPNVPELLRKIIEDDPVLPYAPEERVPRSLIKLSIQCLAKRPLDRPASAGEMASRLRSIQEGLAANSRPATRPFLDLSKAFGIGDAEVYRGLVQGLSVDHPIRQSILDWRSFLQGSKPGQAPAIGIFHGPAGNGKTSLISAGLLSDLDRDIQAVYLSADHPSTADQLASALGAHRRQDRRGKLLIVLDHLERVLRAGNSWDIELVANILSQADGVGLQVVLVVRDDALQRVADLCSTATKGSDLAVVQLQLPALPRAAAGESLFALGRKLAMLPEDRGDLSRDQQIAMNQVLSELETPCGIPIWRLARFARMIRGEWVPLRLSQLGGVVGVGSLAIDEALARLGANVSPKRLDLIRLILANLLPFDGRPTEGDGGAHPLPELPGSRWKSQPGDLERVLRLLEDDLRLIVSIPRAEGPNYRLADRHEARLVRHWLARKRPTSPRSTAATDGFEARCPHCLSSRALPVALQGRELLCPNCSRSFVPGSPDTPDLDESPAARESGRGSSAPIPLLDDFKAIRMTDDRQGWLPELEEDSPVFNRFRLIFWLVLAIADAFLLSMDSAMMNRTLSTWGARSVEAQYLFALWHFRWGFFGVLILAAFMRTVAKAIRKSFHRWIRSRNMD